MQHTPSPVCFIAFNFVLNKTYYFAASTPFSFCACSLFEQALKQDVFKASRAPTSLAFEDKTAPAQHIRPDYVVQQRKMDAKLWTDYARLKTVTCGQVTSNMAESSINMIGKEVKKQHAVPTVERTHRVPVGCLLSLHLS